MSRRRPLHPPVPPLGTPIPQTTFEFLEFLETYRLGVNPVLAQDGSVEFWAVCAKSVDPVAPAGGGFLNFTPTSAHGRTLARALEKYIARDYWIHQSRPVRGATRD